MANEFVARNGLIARSDSQVSGSSTRVTGSVIVTGSVSSTLFGFTGSLLGTASYVSGNIHTGNNPALSASFAVTASYVTGSIHTTGNLATSASFAVTASYSLTSAGIGGSGTVNRHAKFTGTSTTIGDSLIYDDGTNVQITGSNTIISGNIQITAVNIAVSGASTALMVTGSIMSTGTLKGWNTYILDGNPASPSGQGGRIRQYQGNNSPATAADLYFDVETSYATGIFQNLMKLSYDPAVASNTPSGSVSIILGSGTGDFVFKRSRSDYRYFVLRSAYNSIYSWVGTEGNGFVTDLYESAGTGFSFNTPGSTVGQNGYISVLVGVGVNSARSTNVEVMRITSASVAVTGSLSVIGSVSASAGFTGSLFGTSSYVTGSIHTAGNLATSASYAITASYALNSSAGASDFPYTGSAIISGSLSVTGSLGVLGSSLVTSGSGFYVASLTASEALSAGDYVNISVGGVRKASSDNQARQAHGFVNAAYSSTNPVTVLQSGLNNYVSGLTAGSRYFLSASGAESATPTTRTGSISQEIGVAISPTAILVNLGPAILT